MKTVLGLDLGTNSIGWALIQQDENDNPIKIIDLGSRIIPMGAELSKFEQGQAQTKNANRRIDRGSRKLNKRYKQRRNKLIYILQKLNMLPEQIKLSENFDNPLRIDKVSILPIAKSQKQYSAFDLIDLRTRALVSKVSLEELGKIIYLFNQLRGYSGGGAEPERESETEEENESAEKKGKESYITFAKIIKLSDPEQVLFKNRSFKKTKVVIETEDGIIEGETLLDILKEGESLELQIITRKSKQGDTITFKLPNKTSWRKKMENLEIQLNEQAKEKGREIFLSEYLLEILKDNQWARIRNNVVLRSRYESEFNAIWEQQSKHHSFLNATERSKLSEILSFVFPGSKQSQDNYRKAGIENGLKYIIKEQIIYYQRELKDQSHLISNCRFEKEEKVIAKSHPIFQEYKIWEQINKLTINTKVEVGHDRKGQVKYAYVDRSIPAPLQEWLFEELQSKKEISFNTILSKLKKEYSFRDRIDFLNGLNAKAKLKGNETKLILEKTLGRLWNILGLEQIDKQVELWDILYNGKGNEYDLQSDRTSKILKLIQSANNDLSNIEQVAVQISKIKFSRSYSTQSLKAIEKILPLVRAGKYFNSNFSDELNSKIVKLQSENLSDPFEKSAQEYLDGNIELLVSGGIMNAYATILVYDKHTAKEYAKDEIINSYKKIQRLKQGELRNPLVEQLISETLIIIKDIWKKSGNKPTEIRLELSRELKNNADRRAKIYSSNRDNYKANEEIKESLLETAKDITIENIEKHKLDFFGENLQVEYVKQYKAPSKSEIEKLKLWKEQGQISPYSGQTIPIAELFNRERYDVDHIIPQSRYFDDSLANKIICEKSINTDKGNKTAMEYFESGSITQKLLSKDAYIDLVNKMFYGAKRKNLLAMKVPEDPIARQMKETQYISVRVKEELNKIVGNDKVKTTTGSVTDYLRNQWGLTDKFKGILKSRYENIQPRLADDDYKKYLKKITEDIEESKRLGVVHKDVILNEENFKQLFNQNYIAKKNNKWIIKGWSKRIDHRHHAIDALVVACTKPEHVKRLNDLNKELQSWLDSHRKELLPDFEGSPTELLDEILNLDVVKRERIFTQIEKFRTIESPWIGFLEEAEQKIKGIIVSIKPKNKLLIQINNDGEYQIKIRGQLHEGTLYGKSQGLESYRIPLIKLANKTFATEKTIEKIANPYLREIVSKHLKDSNYKKEDAFSAEGILDLNTKLSQKKNLKGEVAPHTPISYIKVFYRDPTKIKKKKGQEEVEDALQRLDRKKAYNDSLYVKTGDNYLFAIMDKDDERTFDLITFFDAANLLKEEFNKSEDKKIFNKDLVFKKYFEEKNQAKLLFTLKQNDMVYLPSENEEVVVDLSSPLYSDFWNNKVDRSKNVYAVVKFSKTLRPYFIKHDVADPIERGVEFGSQNCLEKIGGISIKDFCIKLNVDRLGNIKPA
jgi:CRISPR-associated endonuclease Csn1